MPHTPIITQELIKKRRIESATPGYGHPPSPFSSTGPSLSGGAPQPRRGPGRPKNPARPLMTGPPRPILPAPNSYGGSPSSHLAPSSGLDSSHTTPSPQSYPNPLPRHSSVMTSKPINPHGLPPPPSSFFHGPTNLPPQPYIGDSPMSVHRPHSQVGLNQYQKLPVLEARIDRLENAVDKYVDHRREQALQRSALPYPPGPGHW